ncbi:DUF6783 domain-containing protein [Blautia wexlerae]|uniref:DUF6783 domain-containing protein n=1 Tax=Blautia wexlerae TaxID=418240 RepID=UPI002FE6E5A2
MKNHSRNLHAPFCGIFHPNSVAVAHYGALIRAKYPTNCDAHLAESLFQTRSSKNRYENIFSVENSCTKDYSKDIKRNTKHEQQTDRNKRTGVKTKTKKL